MILGERLRQLREQKKLSQGDIEKKANLLRCYISRCENCHTVPSVATLEKWAGALEVPLYRLFYEGAPKAAKFKQEERSTDVPEMKELRKHLAKMSERDRSLLFRMATTMARQSRKKVN